MKTKAPFFKWDPSIDFSTVIIAHPLSGLPDTPEHYHTVTIDLTGNGIRTEVMLAQDHNATEAARMHSEKNWKMMLDGLKKYVEKW
jgi:hypothetical protein